VLVMVVLMMLVFANTNAHASARANAHASARANAHANAHASATTHRHERAAAPLVVRIAAASDLQFVLPKLIEDFSKRWLNKKLDRKLNTRLEAVYGSSGNFTAQIRAGAPFHCFLSADTSYTNTLVRLGRAHSPCVYARGRLALWCAGDVAASRIRSALNAHDSLAALVLAVRRTATQTMTRTMTQTTMRLAMPNPAHAPYGRAASEVLCALQDKLNNASPNNLPPMRTTNTLPQCRFADVQRDYGASLILADNASQAAQMAVSGVVEAAFVPRPLLPELFSRSSSLPRNAVVVLVPEELHAPLVQSGAVIVPAGANDPTKNNADATAVAEEFLRFLQSPEAASVLALNGLAR
jgi:molybdate transport system substrate-binding protein